MVVIGGSGGGSSSGGGGNSDGAAAVTMTQRHNTDVRPSVQFIRESLSVLSYPSVFSRHYRPRRGEFQVF